MAYINGKHVLLNAEIDGGAPVPTCTVVFESTLGTTIAYVAATTYQNETFIKYEFVGGTTAPSSRVTIENVVCGSLMYIHDTAGGSFAVSNGATVVGQKFSNGYLLTAPTQTGTTKILIDV